MSKLQRVLILCGLGALLATGLVPPWRGSGTAQHSTYYSPIFIVPHRSGTSSWAASFWSWRIAWDRLALEWACIGIVTTGLVIATVRKP